MGQNDTLLILLGVGALILLNMHSFNSCRDANGKAVSCASGSGAVSKAPGLLGLGIGPL